MSRRQIKSFSVQQFFKNAAEVWASSPHLRSKSKICNMVFLLQLHFLKLANSQLDCLCETSYKFGQGNGAIAARWQTKAGVNPPFAGRERPFSLRIFHLNSYNKAFSKILPLQFPLKFIFQEMQLLQKPEKIEKLLLQSRNFVNFLTTDHEIWYNKRMGRKISFLISGGHLAEPPEISIRIERT